MWTMFQIALALSLGGEVKERCQRETGCLTYTENEKFTLFYYKNGHLRVVNKALLQQELELERKIIG